MAPKKQQRRGASGKASASAAPGGTEGISHGKKGKKLGEGDEAAELMLLESNQGRLLDEITKARKEPLRMKKKKKKERKDLVEVDPEAAADDESAGSDAYDSEEEALRQIKADKAQKQKQQKEKKQSNKAGKKKKGDDGDDGDDGEAEDDEETGEDEKVRLAVLEKLGGFELDLSFVETLAVVPDRSDEPAFEDAEDDLQREVEFYRQALAGVKRGRALLDEDGSTPHMRPIDYMAEMVKSDAHMARVKQNLLFEKKKIEAFEVRKQQKEYKKFAKTVQSEKLKEKAVKRKREKDVALEFQSKTATSDLINGTGRRESRDDGGRGDRGGRGGRGGARGGRGGRDGGDNKRAKPNGKREYKDKKYGHAGRASRKNDSESLGNEFVKPPRTGGRPGFSSSRGGRGGSRGGRGGSRGGRGGSRPGKDSRARR